MKVLFANTGLEIRRLGHNIQVARKRRKMNVSQLAIKAETSRQAVTRIEAGDPSVAISKVFNVLNALGLLNGISNFVDPDMDRSQAIREVKELRESAKNKKTKKVTAFTKEELNF